MNPTARRALRIGFGLLGAGYLAWTLRNAIEAGRSVVPPVGTVILALVLVLAGIVGASRSWVALFERPGDERRLAAGFIVSQAAKYAPFGGVVQAAGQIGLATSDQVTARRAGSMFVTHVVAQVVAAAAVGGLAAFVPGLPTTVRILLALGLLSPFVLVRGWLQEVVVAGLRLLRRPAPSPAVLPSQRALVIATLWSLAPILSSGTAFALLLGSLDPGTAVAHSVLAFAASWLIGYLAFPFPSGLGVREAVLASMLGSAGGVVVAASLVHRVVTMAAELLLLVLSWRRAR